MKRELPKEIKCPKCRKGKIMADKYANGIISCQCPKCGAFFRADLNTLEVIISRAERNR